MTAELRQPRASNWDEEIELLARALPSDLARALHERIDPTVLLEIVLDLGREPEARVPGREVLLADHPVSASDLEHVANNVGQFSDDNRAGIERTLHRVSDRKSTRLNSSHQIISYAVFCLKKKTRTYKRNTSH